MEGVLLCMHNLFSVLLCLPLALARNSACYAEVHHWFLTHGPGLIPRGLALKQITTQLPLLLRCMQAPVALLDVGAGVHGLGTHWKRHATSLHEDDSDALWLLGGFKNRARVHAFEANPEKAAELKEVAATRSFTKAYTEFLHVHAEGVGAQPHTARLKMCGTPNAWAVEGTGRKGVPCRLGSNLTVTTLDTVAASLSVPLLYAKVDVEGGEMDVLGGMEKILAGKKVHLMSFEYGVGWHKNFLLRRPLSKAERLEAANSSLRYFAERLSGYGFDTYLINSGNKSTGVVLIPVYDRFWHDDFEVCFHRAKVYGNWGQWCWNDLLVVRRDSHCVKKTLFEAVLPATRGQGRSGLEWRGKLQRAMVPAYPSCGSRWWE